MIKSFSKNVPVYTYYHTFFTWGHRLCSLGCQLQPWSSTAHSHTPRPSSAVDKVAGCGYSPTFCFSKRRVCTGFVREPTPLPLLLSSSSSLASEDKMEMGLKLQGMTMQSCLIPCSSFFQKPRHLSFSSRLDRNHQPRRRRPGIAIAAAVPIAPEYGYVVLTAVSSAILTQWQSIQVRCRPPYFCLFFVYFVPSRSDSLAFFYKCSSTCNDAGNIKKKDV